MDDIVRSVQQFYDTVGTHFSRTRSKTYEGGTQNWPVTDVYLKRLWESQSVLDVGCGNGRLVSGLPNGVKYTGFDFSKTLLAEAKKQFPGQRFLYGDVLDKSIWEKLGTYDAVFCVAVLHHIPERQQQVAMLKHIRKHLAPKGFFYLTVWNLWQEKYVQYHLGEKNWAQVPYLDRERFCVAFDVQSLTDVLSEAGWKIDELFYADYHGKKSDVIHGQNLVAVAR